MVLQQLFKLGQKSQEEEFKDKMKEEMEAKKASEQSEKSSDFQHFLKSPESVRLIEDWKKKGFTKRGVTKLLAILFPAFKSNKGVVSAAKDLLASLKGEDGLSRVLSILKLVPEGIMRGLK